MHNPFARKRPNPKRTEPRRTGDRVIIRGMAKAFLRRDVATRAHEHCETCGAYAPIWTEPFKGRDGKMVYAGELSHKRHGANKSDTMEETMWECRECHQKRHNAGGKPVVRKPGRQMNQTEALAYWKATVCFCGGEKREERSFCPECLAKLPKQLQRDVENTIGLDWLRSVALAEQALLNQETK